MLAFVVVTLLVLAKTGAANEVPAIIVALVPDAIVLESVNVILGTIILAPRDVAGFPVILPLIVIPLNDDIPEVDNVVKAPEPAVVLPILPGDPNVAPLNVDAFKFATLVDDAIVNGAVPVDKVEVITPVAEIVVKEPVDAIVLPILPGLLNVAPLSNDEFKFATTVDDETVNGAVPVDKVLVITPLEES